MSERVIMFCFGGRRANLELQLPFIRELLGAYPELEYHLWNTAKDPNDAAWMQGADEDHPRFHVRNEFSELPTGKAWNEIYRYYAGPEFEGCLFVKLDDDVVFIETGRFDHFLWSIRGTPGSVITAKVVNNGACGQFFPSINELVRKRLRIRLLDVHMKPDYAKGCHELFLDNWQDFTRETLFDQEITDWLSINFIGYNHDMAVKIAGLLETPAPRRIAGRLFTKPNAKLGDEGLVNTLPRIMLNGFTVCHLTFGPQERRMRPAEWDELRKRYDEVGREYRKL